MRAKNKNKKRESRWQLSEQYDRGLRESRGGAATTPAECKRASERHLHDSASGTVQFLKTSRVGEVDTAI